MSRKSSGFSCYCGQERGFQRYHSSMFEVKFCRMISTCRISSALLMKLTLTYIWSRVWPRVVLDDGSTPAVRRSLKNASILETEHDSSTLAFSRYTFSIKGKVRQFLLTKVSLLFLGSIAQPVTTVCENVTRKPDIQTKYVQTSLHGHCWWKSSVELYHRKSFKEAGKVLISRPLLHRFCSFFHNWKTKYLYYLF